MATAQFDTQPRDPLLGVSAVAPRVGDDAETPPRKRAKKAQSCDACRRRKLKCDRGWPCGACRDRNEQHMCTWEDGVVPEHAGRDANETAQVLQRLASVESQLERLLGALERGEGGGAPRAARHGAEDGCGRGCGGKGWAAGGGGLAIGGGSLAPAGPPADALRSPRADDLGCDGLFGLSWQSTSIESMRRTLVRMHSFLPGADEMVLLLDVYVKEIDWMQQIAGEQDVRARIDELVRFGARANTDAEFVQRLGPADAKHLIYSAALLFAVFGISLVFTRNLTFSKLYEEHGSTPVHGRFFHEALLGVSMLNVYEEPHIDFVVVLVFLVCGICSLRAPAVGVGLLNQAIQVALLLDLDTEPPASMPPAEATRRVQLYALLAIHDWFSTSTIKRYPQIRRDMERLPSVFGSEEQQRRHLSPFQMYKLKIAHLYCRSSALLMPMQEDYTYVCALHEETLAVRAQMPPNWSERGDAGTESPETTRELCLTMGTASLNYLLIRIHLQFYVRGWTDPRFLLSRDTCFSAARSLLRLFRDAFSWKVPAKPGGTATRSIDTQVPDELSIVARMWWFCHWSTAAALLLLKHLTILNERNEYPSWDPERESIVQDLCIMSRLLHYLSPVMSIARDGYVAMQRVAAHALRNSFDVPREVDDNCVANWADRIVQARLRGTGKHGAAKSCTPPDSAEPMSMLSDIVLDRRTRARAPHLDESPPSALRVDRHSSSGSSLNLPDTPHLVQSPAAADAASGSQFRLYTQSSALNTSSSDPQSADAAASRDSSASGSSSAGAADLLTADLDTFWAKFAAPTVSIPTPASDNDAGGAPMADALTQSAVFDRLAANASLPDVSGPMLPSASAAGVSLDSAFLQQQKDRLTLNPFNFPMGSLGPIADDFLKSFETYSKTLDTDSVVGLNLS
ncbi:hypothetical protein MSPP1_003880 [Malassezia sp. CBS 17886]|nr:hypothetical protein MSPP1_003880 [Malassezia sp. CBS 17886]